MPTDIYLSALEHFIKEEAPEVETRRVYRPDAPQGSDQYALIAKLENTILGYFFSDNHTGPHHGEYVIRNLPTSLLTKSQLEAWNQVLNAYERSVKHALFQF